jgi:hypothetical protein
VFWVAGEKTLGGLGEITLADPELHLPVLCTQTAPYSNDTGQDTSAKWQVAVTANNETLTG